MATLSLARAYQHSFDTHPNITLALTGGCLNSLGDFVAQITEKTLDRNELVEYRRYDFPRTLRFFFYGFTISPFLGRWNSILERWFPLRALSGSRKVSVQALSKRVACDQLVMAPIGLALFLGSMGIMERRNFGQIKEKYTDLYMPALFMNWKVWPIAQLINFRYMPLPYRVPFQSGCGVFWTLYLSHLNAKEDQKQDLEAASRHHTPNSKTTM
ncbi:Protein SYM1 [Hypsizygus marmoreus]|uniref:Protein SYM1 n=1 Tax=Hypsizygus marmoreus TaxID=39966 RepID=A0A369K7P1_HYPMA|nr:Protein SYM1 [Hypsizygus marmoreus]